jgi:type III restriction enzyme
MEFATTETEVHQADLAAGDAPMAQVLLASITNKAMQRARLANVFAELYPLVRTYVATCCFGKAVDVEDETIRSHLRRLELQEGIARYLARKIGELTVEKLAFEFANAGFKLSDTSPFSWRRNLPPLLAQRTVFNYVATYNDFERRFAQFLDAVPDVVRFASLGTTEQGDSSTQFRVDYLKPSGAIGFYHPDWVVVQKTGQGRAPVKLGALRRRSRGGEMSWIIETKGRVWEGTEAKDTAMQDWCARVNQSDFEARAPHTLAWAVQICGQGGNMLV